MPNIEIRGYSPEQAILLKKEIDQVVGKMGIAKEAITSIVPLQAETCDPENFGRYIQPAPYLRIYDTDKEEICKVIEALWEEKIFEDVESVLVHSFVSKDQMRRNKEISLGSL